MNSTPAMAAPPRTNRNWIWFFVIVGVLAVGAVTTMIWYNLAQQLQPERLAEAKALWQAKQPASYDLVYTVKREGASDDRFHVRVRQGQTVELNLNGRGLPLSKAYYHGMQGLLRSIGDFQKQDTEPGKPRTFTKAVFDADNGRLIRYIRRVMGSRERVEIVVDEFKIPSDAR